MGQCLPDTAFEDLVAERASAEQLTLWKRHLRDCDLCATKFIRLRAGLKTSSQPENHDISRSRRKHQCAGRLESNVLVGDFRIEKLLGSGGMGTVYQARQLSLNRSVALKVLSPGLVATEESVKRFHLEARAAAKLHHTNIVAIFAEGQDKGTCYYAMELIQGETLEQLMGSVREYNGCALTWPNSTTAVGTRQAGDTDSFKAHSDTWTALGQTDTASNRFNTTAALIADVADALAYAHEKGIVHRDVKPANLMLSHEGRVSLMDFGVAKMLEEQSVTVTGSFVGTPRYMSPEQVRADHHKVDSRTDIYSLGVTLYELLTLRVPFDGETREQVIGQILNKEPRRPRKIDKRIPRDLETICLKAIEKEPSQRYQTAKDLADDLRRYLNQYTIAAKRASLLSQGIKFVKRNRLATCMTLGIVMAVSMAGLIGWKYATSRWIHKVALPQIRSCIDSGQYAQAFGLAEKAQRLMPDLPELAGLWPKFSVVMSIDTDPVGADVYVKPYDDMKAGWHPLGQSPINHVRFPIGLYRWKATKAQYADREIRSPTGETLSFELEKAERVPQGMVQVDGGLFRLDLAGLSNHQINLSGFYMDRYEVTNREFKQFVDDGGYQNETLWKPLFVRQGQTQSWHNVVKLFVDKTGQPGPANWQDGTYLSGHAEDPVGGVSWYEASAYAKYAGRQLPTVYHWARAGLTGGRYSGTVLAYSNFDNQGVAPRGQYQGFGNYGTYDMAGNVREWCLNADGKDKRYLLGGAWNDRFYSLVTPTAVDPLDRTETNGFRCAVFDSNAVPLQANEPIVCDVRDFSREEPVPQSQYEIYKETLYAYDRRPLNEKVVEADESEFWRHEIVQCDTAYDSERLIVHLFLPKNSEPPYQTVVYFPGSSALFLYQFSTKGLPEFFLRHGIAVAYPIYKGTYERNTGHGLTTNRPDTIQAYRDHVIWWAKDLSRSIDYLQTRKDIDSERVAYYGLSWGAILGGILPAVEPRIKACVLLGAGFYFEQTRPEVDLINFTPHVTVPVLMLNGRYDSILPVDTSQIPMFNLLGTPVQDKRHVLIDSGHLPRERITEETLNWLKRYFGPVTLIEDMKGQGQL